MTTDVQVQDASPLPEEGFHEIQLSGKQLVFLFMATTVVSVVIFLCGVLVGRGVRDEGIGASLLSLPQTTETVATDVSALTSVPESSDAGSSATAPVGAPGSEAEPGGRYYDQLMSDRPPVETVSPPPQPDQAEAVTQPATLAEGPAPPAATPVVPPAVASSGWVVQVTALRQRQEAQAVATRLVDKGYKAFVMDPQAGATQFFRVRVGPFQEKSDAERIVKRLVEEEQFKPWISR